MSFSENLKRIRIKKGISQQALADAAGFSQTAVYHWEKGVRTPKIGALARIASVLDVSIEDFFIENKEGESVIDLDASGMSPDEIQEYATYILPEYVYSDGNTHKYDASIPIEVTPERIERNRIQNKLLAGEHVTPEELEVLNSYYSSEQFRNSYKKLKEVAQEGLATIERLKTAYIKLNDIGQEKVAEHAEMIAKIPEYRKNPDEEPQED